MANSLKNKTISGMLWSLAGRFGAMVITFVSNIVLARLLTPEDFGCIGMLQIFIAISEILVLGGFGMALIQKKDASHRDYSTVFYWNLVSSVLLYLILFISAPFIASFYRMPLLCDVLRIQSLAIIIYAFSVVQSSQLQKSIKFKELSIRSVISAIAGTSVAVIMAFQGYGIWSLVASTLVTSLVSVLLLWKLSDWRPTWEFDKQSFKDLFAFGGLMALSSLMEKVYSNIQGLLIGRLYSPALMGYYSQAHKLEQIPTSVLSQVVNQVTFPVFSKLQDDRSKLINGLRKNLIAITYINFPLSMLMIGVATDLILLLYGSKWLPAVPYFQILCLSGMVYTMNTTNANVVKALGNSKLYFWTKMIKRTIGIILISVGAYIGMMGLLVAVAANSYIDLIINTYINKRLINYGITKQFKDIGGSFICSAISLAIIITIPLLVDLNNTVMMFLQIIVFISSYLALSAILQLSGYKIYEEIIKARLIKR